MTNADAKTLSRGNIILNQDMADVESVGIRQTPTFFLDGKRLENVSPESLISEVMAAVESV